MSTAKQRIIVICGVNWGDEGKGRVVDYLAHDADVVCRYQGGSNAGHTVVNQLGTFKLHLVPSGIFNPDCLNILGPGMLINPEFLLKELAELEQRGVAVNNSVRVSDRATLALPIHALEDEWEEERLGKNAYGSTRTGIAPGYSDKYLKKSLLVADLFRPQALREKVAALCAWKHLTAMGVYGKDKSVLDETTLYRWLTVQAERILPMVTDTSELLDQCAKEGRKIIFEAQLGALRDVSFGIYPFVSSSCTLASFVPIGAGFFTPAKAEVVGVMKAFSTCVGTGPFVSEMAPEEANALRETSLEYGATTGRPRRIGHFDAVASAYGARLQSASHIVLTKLDSLSNRESLKICVSYTVDGQVTRRFPDTSALEVARPNYIEVEGWQEDISACRRFGDLPPQAQTYVKLIEGLVGVPITHISVGAHRDAMIVTQ